MTDFRGVQCIYSIYMERQRWGTNNQPRSTYIARYWHKLPLCVAATRQYDQHIIQNFQQRNRPATDSFPLLILQIQLYIVTELPALPDIGTNCHQCVAAAGTMRSAYNIELSTRIEVEMTDFRGVQCIQHIYGKDSGGNKQLGLKHIYCQILAQIATNAWRRPNNTISI